MSSADGRMKFPVLPRRQVAQGIGRSLLVEEQNVMIVHGENDIEVLFKMVRLFGLIKTIGMAAAVLFLFVKMLESRYGFGGLNFPNDSILKCHN